MFRPYGIVGKDFFRIDNVCGNVVTVFQKHL